MMKDLRTYKIFNRIPVLSLIGLLVGVLGGYLYYQEIGCKTGTCAITSNPYLSMLWGGIMGYLLLDMFRKSSKNEHEKGSDSQV